MELDTERRHPAFQYPGYMTDDAAPDAGGSGRSAMVFHPAVMEDLPVIQTLYRTIQRDMEQKNIAIWDEVYPCEFFAEDIREHRLYALFDRTEAVAAFALCRENGGAQAVGWENPGASARYIDRLGMSPARAGQGIGRRMLDEAERLALADGAQVLRLFVADYNSPAIHLYETCGFVRAKGAYLEQIPDSPPLRQYGYEKELRSGKEA